MGKLTARQVETLKIEGRHSDGDNLYLDIAKGGSKSWVFLYRFSGKQREIGLGSSAKLTLADARRAAVAAQRLIIEGKDPKAEKIAAKRAELGKVSFGIFADEFIKSHRVKYRNQKHAAQWQTTLGPNYCSAIRNLAINEIDTSAILKVLKPIWQKIPETASRIRGRIENVMDAAKVQGLYAGENPARWKGHLEAVLPARQKLTRGHHAALPYADFPKFISELRLRSEQGMASYALEFCILTASRSGEVLGAVWSEVDLEKGVWVIPASRMKAGHEHRIPLSKRAVEVLTSVQRLQTSPNSFVFAGQTKGKGLSNMAMSQLLKRMERQDITVHGFRSTFRDWASEQTSFSHETCEHALAHRISDKAEAAYRRGDQFEKRRKLMEAWDAYSQSKPLAEVIAFKR